MTGDWLNWIGGGAAVVTAGVAAWHLRGRWQMAKRKKKTDDTNQDPEPKPAKPVIFAGKPTPDVIVPPLPPEPKGRALFDGISLKDVPVKHIVANPDPAWVPPIIEKHPEIVSVGPFVLSERQGDGPIVLEPLRDDAALAERAWAATAYASTTGERAAVEAQEAAWEADVMAYPAEEPPLRQDGPTKEEWIAAGYPAEVYPPQGYAPRTASVRQPDTYILSRVEPNPGHIGNYPAGQWSPSKAASDGGGPGTYEIRAMIGGEEHSRSYIIVHPDGRVESKS